MSCVKDGRALPAPLLVLGQFAELRDDPLPRPSLGALGFDEGEVGVSLAVLGALVYRPRGETAVSLVGRRW